MKKKDNMTDLIDSLPQEDEEKTPEKPEDKPRNSEGQVVRDSNGNLVTLDVSWLKTTIKTKILKLVEDIDKKYKKK